MKNWKNTDKWKAWLPPTLAIAGAIILWDLYVIISGIDRWLLPRPHEIAIELFASRALIAERMTETLTATAIGLLAAISIPHSRNVDGLVKTGAPDGVSFIGRIAVDPVLCYCSFAHHWFGFGLTPKVLVVMLVCLFPMTVNLADGYMQVDRDILRVLQSMGATRWQIYKMVKLPGALPSFFSGLKIAGTYSVLGTVVSEMLGGNRDWAFCSSVP